MKSNIIEEILSRISPEEKAEHKRQIDENMRMTEVKKAPFIHKEKEDLTQILLDKFYYLSLKQKA